MLIAAGFAAACSRAPDPSEDKAAAVHVAASEMRFAPTRIEGRVGQPLRIHFQNDGVVLHDFNAPGLRVRALRSEGAVHAHGHAQGAHADSAAGVPDVHVAAEPGQSASLEFTPLEAGEYEVFCSVPGHREAGMVAQLVVRN
jgi:uncharacterized cupredoxin-like copper-binding protein